MKLAFITLVCLLLSGCDPFGGPKLKCEGGVIYMRDNGAWIQAKLYEQNKCLPMEEKP